MAAPGEVRGEVTDRGGWRLQFAPAAATLSDVIRDKVITVSVAAAAGQHGLPVRRSRHAVTYQVRAGGVRPEALDAFVKVYDPARGLGGALRHIMGGGRAAHAARISAALAARGFGVPRVILCGEEAATGRTMMVAERAAGTSIAAFLAEPSGPQAERRMLRKREVLRALGTEIARLHRAGFIHGDLTPYNVFVADSAPICFTFIDHDRTRRAFAIGRRRRQLRNFVQLLRFDLPRLTASDRLRIFQAWTAGLDLQRRNSIMHRGFKMLKLRIARDSRKLSYAKAEQGMATAGPAIAGKAGAERADVAG